MGFNRYIVECKSVGSVVETRTPESFNRYIVECKYDPLGLVSDDTLVLIDT